jgi:hypothetical protein
MQSDLDPDTEGCTTAILDGLRDYESVSGTSVYGWWGTILNSTS